MYCRYCGAEIREGKKFCPNCGRPVEEEAEATPKKSHTRTIVIIAVAAVVIAIIAVIVVLRLNGSEEPAAEPEQTEETEIAGEMEMAGEAEQAEETEQGGEITAQDFADHVLVSDAEISLSSRLRGITLLPEEEQSDEFEEADDLYYTQETATAEIANNNDEPCMLTIGYEYTITSVDNYGDEQVETGVDEFEYDIAANETRTVATYLGEVDPDVQKSYTGKLNERIQKYEGEDVLLPVDAVTDIEVTNGGGESLNFTFTLLNNSSVNWASCTVTYQIFLDGVYNGEKSVSANDIRYGETATLTGGLVVEDSQIDFGDLKDQLTVTVSGVTYRPEDTGS